MKKQTPTIRKFYWIQGEKGSGKTTLARAITAVSEESRCQTENATSAAIRRLAKANEAIIYDDPTPEQQLIFREIYDKPAEFPTLYTVIVTSNKLPDDPAIRSRFHLIQLTPATRENATRN